MAKAKRERRSSFRTMQSGDDVLSRLDAIEALEAAEERARAEALPEAEEDDAEEARGG
jgi:hypothetical protein